MNLSLPESQQAIEHNGAHGETNATNIRAIAHANGGDVKTVYAVGVPPVGRAEKTNLFLGRELGDKFGDGSAHEIARHVGELDGGFATTETTQAGDAEPWDLITRLA